MRQSLLLGLLVVAGCGDTEAVSQPPHAPPIAHGEVCVDTVPADAEVRVNGEVFQARCMQLEQSYRSEVEVHVRAEGHKPQTVKAALAGGTETVKVVLEELPRPVR